MLQETNVMLFLVASLVLIATPGPDMIYVITRGVAQGRRAALFSACGVCCGLAVHTSFAAIGLSAVAFSVVKYAGAASLSGSGCAWLSPRRAAHRGGVLTGTFGEVREV